MSFIAVLIAFLGVYFGLFIGQLAKEELKAGAKYFQALQNVIVSLMVYFLLQQYIRAYAIAISLLTLLFMFGIKNLARDLYIYPMFGFIIGLDPTITQFTLALLYGFPSGSLLFQRYRRKSYIRALHYSTMVLAYFLAYLVVLY